MKSKIYTSYFANLRNIPNSIEPIAISLYTPSFYKGKRALDLAPSKDILDDYKGGKITEEEYRTRYLNLLIERAESLGDWCDYFKDKEVVLVCYEGKDKFCHRRILAELLVDIGFEVIEY